jgi:osmotically-inducible protein OsmY
VDDTRRLICRFDPGRRAFSPDVKNDTTSKAAAEADALKVSGVKRVVNELQVVASSRQEAVSARDDDLQREVRTALDEHAFRDVRLEVRNGVVRLTGHVPTGAQSLEAAVL